MCEYKKTLSANPKYLIALTLIPQVGSVTARKLIAYTGSAEAVFREKKSSLTKIPGIGETVAKQKDTPGLFAMAEKELAFISKNNICLATIFCKDYPDRLKQCPDAPLIIYFQGENVFHQNMILSVVGTRRATSYGKEQCQKIIGDLADEGLNVIIVSGLAYGIDYQAHICALNSGLKTVAVLGHGLHTIYPGEHLRMAIKIRENGALLTDFLSCQDPERNNFIKRNRIIAGLSDATLVVESGISGGALITADIAGSYNRDVFALPARTTDNMSAGCNQLIKNNKAGMIESAKDLMYFLGWEKDKRTNMHPQRSLFTDLSEEENKVLKILERGEKLSVDYISIKTNLPVSRVSSLLLNLEFSGFIKIFPGNYYKLK